MGRLQTFHNWCIFHRDKVTTFFVMPFPILFFAFFLISSLPYEFILYNSWLYPIIDAINIGMVIAGPLLLASPIVGIVLYNENRQRILIAGAVFWVVAWYIWQFFMVTI